VPLFALANAGIHISGGLLSDAVTSPVTLGILAAFVIGKPLGIMGAAWLASRPVFGGAPLTVTFPALAGGAAAAGAPFTVSVLIATLAFDGALLDQAKIGVLAAAVLAPVLVWLATVMIRRIPAERRARQLGATADTIVDLAEDVDPAHDHIRGRVDAPVTLIEYGDFECPYCGHAAPVIDRLLGHFGDELRYVFRHLPLSDVHPNAQNASEAAEAAGAQDRFWEMHDVLMQSPDELSPLDLYRHASKLGLDLDRFSEDMRRRRHAARVAQDVRSADASGVSGTPTFFINGRRHQGVYDIDTLTAAVKAAAGASAQPAV
jgi:protein-disulfide isomerase